MAARIDEENDESPGLLRRIANGAMRVFRGVRTAMTCFAMVAAGFADQFDYVDIANWVKTTFSENARLGSILIAVGVGFLCLRMVTKGPMAGFRSRDTPNVDEGE